MGSKYATGDGKRTRGLIVALTPLPSLTSPGDDMATIEQPTPTNRGQWPCPNCGAEYPSPFAASYCCDPELDNH